MIASDEMDVFLREGLGRYADACDAVDAFEQEIEERLLAVLEGKTDWKNFRPKGVERGRVKHIGVGAYNVATGRTIQAFQLNAEAKADWITLGLWWRSPIAREGVLAYCSRWAVDNGLRAVSLPNPRPPVVCSPVDHNKARLYVKFDTEMDLLEIGRLLLDEMDRAFAVPSAAPSPT
jgi:hypothetical protein